MRRSLPTVLAFLSLPVISAGQSNLIGYHRYPQFRTFSGLPGGGFALTADGEIDTSGALAFYELGQFRTIAGGGVLSPNWSLLGPRGSSGGGILSSGSGNGTSFFETGFSLGRSGGVTASFMWLSGQLDSAINIQYSPG